MKLHTIPCGTHRHRLYFCSGTRCSESWLKDRPGSASVPGRVRLAREHYGCEHLTRAEKAKRCVYCGRPVGVLAGMLASFAETARDEPPLDAHDVAVQAIRYVQDDRRGYSESDAADYLLRMDVANDLPSSIRNRVKAIWRVIAGETRSGSRGMAGAALASLAGIDGDMMHCAQYGRTPRGKIRCVTMSPDPGPADADARSEAGITRPYRYDTAKAQTRGRPTRAPGINRYPQVYHGQDARRVSVGRNVPVPPPPGGAPKALPPARRLLLPPARAVAGLGFWPFSKKVSGERCTISLPDSARSAAAIQWEQHISGSDDTKRSVRRALDLADKGRCDEAKRVAADASRRVDYWLRNKAFATGSSRTPAVGGLGDVDPRQAIRLIADAIVDSVAAAGSAGAPAGVVYAGLLQHMPNLTANAFNQFIAALVAAGRLRRSGDLLFMVR